MLSNRYGLFVLVNECFLMNQGTIIQGNLSFVFGIFISYKMKRLALVIGMLCTVCLQAEAQYVSEVWVADQGNGTYRNPVLHAD